VKKYIPDSAIGKKKTLLGGRPRTNEFYDFVKQRKVV
jgi:hypothetical protein